MAGTGEAGSGPFIQQLVAGLTPGATYIVSVDVHLHVAGGPNGKSFGIFVDQGGPNVPILLTEFLDNAWHTGVTASFIASASSHLITFEAELDTRTAGVPSNSDVSYYVDNASLNAQAVGAPERAGWARSASAQDSSSPSGWNLFRLLHSRNGCRGRR